MFLTSKLMCCGFENCQMFSLQFIVLMQSKKFPIVFKSCSLENSPMDRVLHFSKHGILYIRTWCVFLGRRLTQKTQTCVQRVRTTAEAVITMRQVSHYTLDAGAVGKFTSLISAALQLCNYPIILPPPHYSYEEGKWSDLLHHRRVCPLINNLFPNTFG